VAQARIISTLGIEMAELSRVAAATGKKKALASAGALARRCRVSLGACWGGGGWVGVCVRLLCQVDAGRCN